MKLKINAGTLKAKEQYSQTSEVSFEMSSEMSRRSRATDNADWNTPDSSVEVEANERGGLRIFVGPKPYTTTARLGKRKTSDPLFSVIVVI